MMNAGRELDALIAEKVMGLHVEWRDGRPLWVGKDLPGTPLVLDGGLFGHTIPNYSTDIARAWEVVEKFNDCRLHRDPKDRMWICAMNSYSAHQPVGEAITAPLAICLAALKAVGIT